MVFAQITDHHLKGQQIVANQIQMFNDAVEHALSQGATFIAYTGDITEDGDPGELKAYARAFAESPIPVYPVIGNHDVNRPYTIKWPDGRATPPNVDWQDLATVGITQESQLHSRINYQMYIKPEVQYDFVREQNGLKCLFVVGDSQINNLLKAAQLDATPTLEGLNPKSYVDHVTDRLTTADSQNYDFVFVCNHYPYAGEFSTVMPGLKDIVFLNGHTHQSKAVLKEDKQILALTGPAFGVARTYSILRLYDDKTLETEEWLSHVDSQGERVWQITESRRAVIRRSGSGTGVVYGHPEPRISATGNGLSRQPITFENREGKIPRYPIEAGVPIQFNPVDTTSPNGFSRIEWDMGDGHRFNTPNNTEIVNHTYTLPGIHRIVMRVVTKQGSSKSARAEFEVVVPDMRRDSIKFNPE